MRPHRSILRTHHRSGHWDISSLCGAKSGIERAKGHGRNTRTGRSEFMFLERCFCLVGGRLTFLKEPVMLKYPSELGSLGFLGRTRWGVRKDLWGTGVDWRGILLAPCVLCGGWVVND